MKTFVSNPKWVPLRHPAPVEGGQDNRMNRKENIDPSLTLRMTFKGLSCHSEEPGRRRICVFPKISSPLMGSTRGVTGRVRDGLNNNLLSPHGERIKVRGGL